MVNIDNLGAHVDGALLVQSQAQKEVTANALLNLLSNATQKPLAITITGNRALTADEQNGNHSFVLSGTPGDFDLTVLLTNKVFFVQNDTDGVCTVKGATGATVAMPVGSRMGLQVDSTNVTVRSVTFSKGRIPLDITSLREISSNEIINLAGHGGILALDSTPILKRVSTSTDKALKVEWAGGNVDEVQFPTVPMPPDLDETVDVTIHLLAKMNAAGDTPTIDVQVFDGIGDTEMGGATAALSSTLAELTVTIANANISGHPLGFFNISLIPGTHATQLVELYAAWIEYTKKLAA